MRSVLATGASAFIILVTAVEASHGAHKALEALHRKHRHAREAERDLNTTLERRGGTCAFPTDAGLVAVTPGSMNGGWAIAPDQSCTIGRYCPYACPAGQVSMQWDPSVTTYSYPGSMNGGLLCNSDGTVSKPFPDRPYCQSTAQNIGVQNNAGSEVAFCQTVLPGDEDMLIPTTITDWSALAVPDTSYWAGTAAHYYINPPGVSAVEGCVWGSNAKAVGNWAPYVAGANSDSSGETFIKLGWNPIYLETTTPFRNVMPTWGVRIECPNGGCNGLPCAIDPTQNSVNEMLGSATDGAGGGAFCVVTVAKGSTANFVVFNSGSAGGQFYQSSSAIAAAVATSATTISPTTTTTTQPSTTTTTTTHPTTTSSKQTTSAPTSWSSKASESVLSVSSSKSQSAQPYYSLFNSTLPSATGQGASTTAAAGPSNTNVAVHTGDARTLELSAGLLSLALIAMLL